MHNSTSITRDSRNRILLRPIKYFTFWRTSSESKNIFDCLDLHKLWADTSEGAKMMQLPVQDYQELYENIVHMCRPEGISSTYSNKRKRELSRKSACFKTRQKTDRKKDIKALEANEESEKEDLKGRN